MVAIDLKSLVARLSSLCRRQLEASAGLTLSRSHYNVEIEHFLLKLVETQSSDAAILITKQGIDVGRVQAELTRALDKLRTGNARAPALSPDIVTLVREAWMLASLEGRGACVRSGHLLAALLTDEALMRHIKESVPSLMEISGDALRRGGFEALTEGSEESAEAGIASAASSSAGGGSASDTPRSGGPLEQFLSLIHI